MPTVGAPSRIVHMFDSLGGSQDLVAAAGDRDLAGLVWVDPADWERLRRRSTAPPATGTPPWTRWSSRSIAESEPLAANPLLALDDAALVDLAGQAERDLRAATALGYRVAAELTRRRPDPSGRPDEEGLSAYALDELALATGLARGVVCTRVAEADALTGRHPELLAALAAGLLPLPAVRRVLDLTSVLTTAECAEVEHQAARPPRAHRPPPAGIHDRRRAGRPAHPRASSRSSTRANTTRVAKDRQGPRAPHRPRRGHQEAGGPREDAPRRPGRTRPERDVLARAARPRGRWPGPATSASRPGPRDPRRPRRRPHPRRQARRRRHRPAPQGRRRRTPGPDQPRRCSSTTPAATSPRPATAGSSGRPAGSAPSAPRPSATSSTSPTAPPERSPAPTPSPSPAPDQTSTTPTDPAPTNPPTGSATPCRPATGPAASPAATSPPGPAQLDHTVRYPDGPTCSCNLGDLCVHHHHLKHLAPGWTLTNHGDGHFTWTTPTGHTHDITPDRDPPEPTARTDPDPPPV